MKNPHCLVNLVGAAIMLSAVFTFSAAASAPAADSAGERCAALAQFSWPAVTVESVEAVTEGVFMGTAGEPYAELPPFCRVVGHAAPTPASHIGFEVWLPLDEWNGRYAQVGNGGLAGTIFYLPLADMLRRGFATAATDNGHRMGPASGAWAIGQPEKVKDFAWRAVHTLRQLAVPIAHQFYSRAPRHTYFYGCSEGGREAHVSAQRFPEDFDGIVAGAPANDWVSLLANFVWNMQAVHLSPESYISEPKLAAVQKAAIAACDLDDGVADGQLGRPAACDFDPTPIRCPGEDADDCLTAPQVEALQRLYRGLHDPVTGEMISPGYARGGEAETSPWGGGIRANVFGEAHGQSQQILFATGFFGGFVFEDPAWDWRSFDFDSDLAFARRKLGALLDGTNADLSAFEVRGGRMIQYMGWLDGSVPPESSIRYYNRVARHMGGVDEVRNFYRLFMAPGTLHCGLGPGANAFGGLMGPAAPRDADHDVLYALQRWIEEGVAPERIIATKYVNDDPATGAQQTRPLCPYPEQAAWDGRGDPDAASSFSCVSE